MQNKTRNRTKLDVPFKAVFPPNSCKDHYSQHSGLKKKAAAKSTLVSLKVSDLVTIIYS